MEYNTWQETLAKERSFLFRGGFALNTETKHERGFHQDRARHFNKPFSVLLIVLSWSSRSRSNLYDIDW